MSVAPEGLLDVFLIHWPPKKHHCHFQLFRFCVLFWSRLPLTEIRAFFILEQKSYNIQLFFKEFNPLPALHCQGVLNIRASDLEGLNLEVVVFMQSPSSSNKARAAATRASAATTDKWNGACKSRPAGTGAGHVGRCGVSFSSDAMVSANRTPQMPNCRVR